MLMSCRGDNFSKILRQGGIGIYREEVLWKVF